MAAPKQHFLVLGATGVSGLIFNRITLKLPSPPKLTLLVRNRSKLPSDYQDNANVRIVEGGLNDSKAVNEAMSGGITTVVSFLGAYVSLSAFIWRTKTTPIADSLPTIFDAMRKHGVKRIFALSTPNYSPPELKETFSWKWSAFALMPRIVVPQGNAEMSAIAKQVAQNEDLDWTVFRVPHLTEGGEEKEVVAGFLGPEYRGTVDLTRDSMCRWILKEVEEGKWVKGLPMLANP